MTRSHPPALLRIVERTLVEECGVRPGERILVATSGGGDSSALLHVLARLSSRLGFELVAHGVDHGLRLEASTELDTAQALAEREGIRFGRTLVRVAPGGNVQARARDARRVALQRAADGAGATRIATAHHADDRAETVLIRLLHGATPRGLGVLPAASGAWIRPMVRARKSDVLSHLRRHRIAFAEDPSNQDRRHLRTSVRFDLLPQMQTLSPAIVGHLCRLADEAIALEPDPATTVLDETGEPVRLRSSHAQAIRRALRLGHPTSIRLPGNREIDVEPQRPPKERVRVREAKALPRGAGPRKSQKGGAKTSKSG